MTKVGVKIDVAVVDAAAAEVTVEMVVPDGGASLVLRLGLATPAAWPEELTVPVVVDSVTLMVAVAEETLETVELEEVAGVSPFGVDTVPQPLPQVVEVAASEFFADPAWSAWFDWGR